MTRNKHSTYRVLRRVALFIVLFSTLSFAQSADEILTRVKQVSGLGSVEPFRLTAGIFHKKEKLGTYQLWRDKDTWRDELVMDKFSDRRVGSKDKEWIQRSPLASWQRWMFEIREVLPVDYSAWSASAKGVEEKKLRGERVNCINFDDVSGSQMCFHNDGTIAGNGKYAFSDFEEFKGKRVPRRITNGDQVVVIETIEEFKGSLSTEAGSDFKGPFSGCFQPSIPLLKDNKHAPYYPRDAKSIGMQGDAFIYAIVEKDGSVSTTWALKEGSPMFSDSSRFAVQHWKYAPAMCGSVPVPYEKVETIHFRMN